MFAPRHNRSEQGGNREGGKPFDYSDEFLDMLLQELRTRLAPIENSLELMRLFPADRLTCARAQEIGSEHLRDLSKLLDELVDVSRVTGGRTQLRREVVELSQIANHVAENIRDEINNRAQQLSVSFPRAPVMLEADPQRLVQILTLLLKNAMKHTGYGGRIWLSARCGGQAVLVRVRHSGIGVNSELLPNAFDPVAPIGWRRGYRTESIGLAMARRLVEMHGGRVFGRRGGPGQGGEFVVRLPIASRSSLSHDQFVEPL